MTPRSVGSLTPTLSQREREKDDTAPVGSFSPLLSQREGEGDTAPGRFPHPDPLPKGEGES